MTRGNFKWGQEKKRRNKNKRHCGSALCLKVTWCLTWNCLCSMTCPGFVFSETAFLLLFSFFFSFEKSWQEPSPNLFAYFHTCTVWWMSEMWRHCCHDLHVIDRCDRLQLWMMIQIIVVCWCVLTCRPHSVSPVAGHHDHTNWGIIVTIASILLSAVELLWYVIHAISIFEKLMALRMQCLCAKCLLYAHPEDQDFYWCQGLWDRVGVGLVMSVLIPWPMLLWVFSDH